MGGLPREEGEERSTLLKASSKHARVLKENEKGLLSEMREYKINTMLEKENTLRKTKVKTASWNIGKLTNKIVLYGLRDSADGSKIVIRNKY